MEVENFDVLRMIEHGKLCYVSSDCVEGRQLIHWLKYHPHMTKDNLFLWITEIIKQIGQFHRLRGEPCYKYVNPYSLIVTEEKKIYLLDTGTDANQRFVRQMQRRSVRENFLPPEEALYQHASMNLDLYGLGRTLQFLLSAVELEPLLTRREERKLRNIISRCLNRQSKKSFHNITEIQTHIPAYEVNGKQVKKGYRKIFLAVLTVVIVIGLYFIGQPIKEKTKEVKTNAKNTKKIQQKSEEELKLIFEMGMIYLLEKEDYSKSREYFQSIAKVHEAAEYYQIIVEWMSGIGTGKHERLEECMIQAEKNLPKQNKQNCYRVLLRAYALLDSIESAESIIRIGSACEALGEKEEVLEEITEKELSEFMAAAYEELGETESAAELYEKQLFMEEKKEVKEELYHKLTILWENADQLDKAGEICLRGINEFTRSTKLRLARIRLLCKDEGVEREICGQTIQEYMEEMPEIVDLDEFKKLQNEYEIKLEGDQVWVGR